jgi:16S rRNA (adenine1518-N6/adenine1519-N6)-dimethyltransferase
MKKETSSKEYITQILQRYQAEAKKSLGQNFLVGDHVVERMILTAESLKPKCMVEIGPGPGSLTRHLQSLPCQDFQVVELDRVWSQHWRDEGLKVIEVDALQIVWILFPKESPSLLISNLPYQISSSLVIERSMDDQPYDHMILMFQKEVAQRIRSQQGASDYGMLSVIAQTFWKVSQLIDAGPREFSPAPKVSSRVLSFQKIPSLVKNRKKYLKFVKGAFLQPRKLLVSNLQESVSLSKERTRDWLLQHSYSEMARPAEISVKDYVDFFNEIG